MSDLRVHGMGRQLVAPDWPPLTLPEVKRLLHRYGLVAQGIRWASPRPLSAAALIETDAGAVFVKRHAEVVRAADGLREEHAFAAHLRARGVPVPAVLTDDAGSSTVSGGGWTWEVQAQGVGADTYRDTLSWEPVGSRWQHGTSPLLLAGRSCSCPPGRASRHPTCPRRSRTSSPPGPCSPPHSPTRTGTRTYGGCWRPCTRSTAPSAISGGNVSAEGEARHTLPTTVARWRT